MSDEENGRNNCCRFRDDLILYVGGQYDCDDLITLITEYVVVMTQIYILDLHKDYKPSSNVIGILWTCLQL